MPHTATIASQLAQVRQHIADAAAAAGREPSSVRLLAVSKTVGADAVIEAVQAGQTAFGENYIQEGVEKIQALRQWLAEPAQSGQAALEWHCIGPIQSNKTRLVAENFDWVQSVDRLKIAQRLSEQRPAELPPLQICLQVNIDGGANKSGVSPEDALALAQRKQRNAHYYDQARLFARLVATHSARLPSAERLFIATGGGPGIMEAANRGAHEMGALTVGLNIALPHEQHPNPYITPSLSFKFHYFALRKMHLMMRAKALVAFPGGFGTLDELFEVITLVQTRKAKPVPIVLFGSEYWHRLFNPAVMIEEGVISEQDLALFSYVDEPQAAWDVIRNVYGLPLFG